MKFLKNNLRHGVVIVFAVIGTACAMGQNGVTIAENQIKATMKARETGDFCTYELTSSAVLRDNRPPERQVLFSETAGHATVRTGNVMFDGLYGMAVHEALLNSVSQIKDNAYGGGSPIRLEAYQTGEFWTYVWTRDLSYSVHLALAQFDPRRAVNSLLFKTSTLKASVAGGCQNQIIQDTGSGGSYPVSSDRVVWALGADATLKFLPADERDQFLRQAYPILHDTIEQDRRLVFDPTDGLYCGEQSFLDWREQTYPGWTRDNVLPIAMSKTLSVNSANYFLLKTTAGYAGRLGKSADETRYAQWAEELKNSINDRFFDPQAGLYSTYLLSDGFNEIRVHRYDLLGESLALLFGISDQKKAEIILKNYPIGPHGPSVVWPQERTVPIYHNQAIWPFVTAYWIKAARQANDPETVDLGIRSLEHLAAFNLSNMENFDFVTGLAEVKGQHLQGPVINSRRQLWSVAGYLSMVQDVVFGLETSWDGIRFRPFITAKMRNETFASSGEIELRDFGYRNTLNRVRVHLPVTNSLAVGLCTIDRIEVNGRTVGEGFVPADSLKSHNQWDVYLQASEPLKNAGPLRMVDVSNPRTLFGPEPPAWDEACQGGITVEDGHLMLHFRHDDVDNVTFNIYRDGCLCIQGTRLTHWLVPDSTDFEDTVHHYAIEAIDLQSGNASHLSPTRCFRARDQQQVILAKDLQNTGGNLVAEHHFENWGKPGDELLAKPFNIPQNGHYQVQVEFSNGSGPVNTGITCAVKKLEILKAGSGEVIAYGYLVMPQSGDWKRWERSSPIMAKLRAGEDYSIRICEDEYSRNMSYLKNNERYTAWPGGGQIGFNYVNIAAIRLQRIAKGSSQMASE